MGLRAESNTPHDSGRRVKWLGVSVECIICDGEDRHTIEERRDAVKAPRAVVVPDFEIPSPRRE